jgi:nucleoside 2-deoxyribosyltransferase
VYGFESHLIVFLKGEFMNRLKGTKFYLAGGMQYEVGLGKSWRSYAKEHLKRIGIGVIDPIDKPTEACFEDEDTQKRLNEICEKGRRFESLDDWVYIDDCCRQLKEHMKPVVGIDLRFVDISDALLVYINNKVHTAGTYAEITHALLQRKPVIMFTTTSIFDIPRWWFGHADYHLFFNSLNKAIDYICRIDNGQEEHKSWKFLNYSKIYGV